MKQIREIWPKLKRSKRKNNRLKENAAKKSMNMHESRAKCVRLGSPATNAL